MSNVNVSVSGPAPVALRAPSAGPEIEGLVLDIFHSLYRKSVSNEIVLRESAVPIGSCLAFQNTNTTGS